MLVIEFALLGLGVGAVYTLLAQGLVVIYRGSGILNFAQGAFAMAGAYLYEEFRLLGWGFTASFIASLVAGGLLGALTHILVMRRLRTASPLMRLIATLGILAVIQGVGTIIYGANDTFIGSSISESPIRLGSILVPQNQLWLFLIAVVLTVVLSVVSHRTTFGLAVSAAAESEEKAMAFGWSPNLLATATWSLGSVLAVAAGILVVPLTGLQVTNLTLIVIAAMATALLGGFTSYYLTLFAGIFIGVVQSEMAFYVHLIGASASFPFLLMVVILVIRGRGLPLRSHIVEKLPSLGKGIPRPRTIIFVTVFLAIGMLTFFPGSLTIALGIQAVAGILLLSIVVVTGFAGQLSLAQFAMAGLGAFIAGRLTAAQHWPFEASLVAGVIGAALIGIIFGMPALRTRGVNLAVLTLGLGFAIDQIIFQNTNLTGGFTGTNVGAAHFFGINIDPVAHTNRYSLFCLLWFVAVSLAVLNLRRSRAGRRMASIRSNERAAASLGVSVFGAKLGAFAIASAIAGLAGILMAFNSYSIVYAYGFDPISSLTAIGNAVIGGVGYTTGAIAGSGFSPGGIGSLIFDHFSNFDAWLALISGALLLIIILQNPDGIVAELIRGPKDPLGRFIQKRLKRRKTAGVHFTNERVKVASSSSLQALSPTSPNPEPSTGEDRAPTRSRPPRTAVLEARNVTVRYGGVVAVSSLDLTISSGEVVGLIGPNGSGKTTIIDALSGYVRPADGSILFNGEPIEGLKAHQRARVGIARSFQSLELFEDLTVRENLQSASDKRDLAAYVSNLFRPGSSVLPEAAMNAVNDFHLQDDLDKRPSELSYGLRRIVAIARTLCTEPAILLLDEPAAGLGERGRNELGQLVRRLAGEWGIGVLIVEHDVNLVMGVSDRVVAIDFGVKIAEGAPGEVSRNPEVVSSYLGTPVNKV